ncbi:unnamed protein product [Lota lota]
MSGATAGPCAYATTFWVSCPPPLGIPDGPPAAFHKLPQPACRKNVEVLRSSVLMRCLIIFDIQNALAIKRPPQQQVCAGDPERNSGSRAERCGPRAVGGVPSLT